MTIKKKKNTRKKILNFILVSSSVRPSIKWLFKILSIFFLSLKFCMARVDLLNFFLTLGLVFSF